MRLSPNILISFLARAATPTLGVCQTRRRLPLGTDEWCCSRTHSWIHRAYSFGLKIK